VKIEPLGATEVTNELGLSEDTFRWSGVRVCLLLEGTGNEHHECTVEVAEECLHPLWLCDGCINLCDSE
jgi:hypothetical protein